MTDLRTLKCSCKAPPGKHDSGRQRRRCTHDLECELVVYVERLERLRDGLRAVLEDLCRKHWDTGLDSEDFDHVMRSAGLFATVPASDEIRAEFDCETMDTWAWSPLVKANDKQREER